MSVKVIDQAEGSTWVAYNGDCVEVVRGIPDASVGYSIYSPPFASLYTYSDSERDMGNCASHEEFYEHYAFLLREIFRVLKPGRLMSVHCMKIPTSKAKDGYIGLRDFPGEIIRLCESIGFILHSDVVIRKDPVTQMQRTKALGLLHKQVMKDSCMSRQGLADYLIQLMKPECDWPSSLVTVRKPGDNPEPVSHTKEDFPVAMWQRYAEPVWMDIREGDTLQKESAREEKDEKHICPLQLEVIRRGVKMWSNPGDVVLSPFMGIGSEGYVSVEERRRFIGAELKLSYYAQAVKNLRAADPKNKRSIFDLVKS